MKKETVYKVLIALLLVLNIAQLGGRFITPSAPPPMGEGAMPSQTAKGGAEALFRDEVPNLLQLDKAQKQQFFRLAREHRERMNALQKAQNVLTRDYFNQSSAPLLEQITDIDKQKITLTAAHFKAVYELLNDEQKQNFDKFKQAALQVIIH